MSNKYSLYQRKVATFDGNTKFYQRKGKSFSPGQVRFIHMCLGISGEAGELVDIIKKHVIYGKPLDLNSVEEELGDLLWYCYNLANELGLDMKQVKAKNIAKLAKRYPKGYSNKDAIKRRDKA